MVIHWFLRMCLDMQEKTQRGEHGTEAFSSASEIPFPRQQSRDEEKKDSAVKERLISQVDMRSKDDKCVLQLKGGGSNWGQWWRRWHGGR